MPALSKNSASFIPSFKHNVGKQSSAFKQAVYIPSKHFVENDGMQNRIKEIRESRGLTLQQLADAAGTTNQQIHHLESGKRKLTQDWMRRLADALQVESHDLIAETRLVPIIGTVGAGAEIFPIDDYPLAQPELLAEHVHPADGLEYVEAPPGGPLRGIVALKIGIVHFKA